MTHKALDSSRAFLYNIVNKEADKMKKLLLTVVIVFSFYINVVNADMGPKPTVDIEIKGINEVFYATLLGKGEGYGPWAQVTEYPGEPADEAQRAEKIFVECGEGEYHYWGNRYTLDGSDNHLHWGYYAPEEFILVIYIPSSDTVIKSDPMVREKFEQYYICDVSNGTTVINENGSGNYSYEHIEVKENNNVLRSLLMIGVRLIITIIVELLIGLLFGYRNRKQIGLIVKTNIFTQLIVNIFFTVAETYGGLLTAIILYVPLEIVVFVIEGLIYHGKLSDKKLKNWIYALLANGVTMYIGLFAGAMLK